MKHNRFASSRRFLVFTFSLLVCLLLCSACKSNEHMYRHNRSHCDCPTF